MHVMQNLSDPGKLGSGIAEAFVATSYGVAFANLLFLPIANKLKLIVDGLVGIANGDHPKLVETKLQSYII